MSKNKRHSKDVLRGRADKSPATSGTYIMGRNCVREVLRHLPQQVVKIYSSSTSGGDAEIAALIDDQGIPLEIVSNETLYGFVATESHQSYVALLKDRKATELKEFLGEVAQRPRSVLVMVDTINDPQNLGAIFRACECFAVDAVIWSKNRGVNITPVVTKVSVGASELVTSLSVSNLGETLRKLKDNGYWIVAADASSDSQSIWSFEFPERCVIVFGSEGEGIQRLLLENSDYKVAVPLMGKIDSLNVSQAVAVFLFRYRQLFQT